MPSKTCRLQVHSLEKLRKVFSIDSGAISQTVEVPKSDSTFAENHVAGCRYLASINRGTKQKVAAAVISSDI